MRHRTLRSTVGNCMGKEIGSTGHTRGEAKVPCSLVGVLFLAADGPSAVAERVEDRGCPG